MQVERVVPEGTTLTDAGRRGKPGRGGVTDRKREEERKRIITGGGGGKGMDGKYFKPASPLPFGAEFQHRFAFVTI